MRVNTKFEFRDELKDTVSGCKGIVVAITIYDTGCTHYSLQQKQRKDGKVPDWESFDDSRLVLVKAANVIKIKNKSGPAPKVPQQ